MATVAVTVTRAFESIGVAVGHVITIVGSDGVGPIGPQGTQGVQGVQGPQGNQGATGPQGSQGAQGVAGPQGSTGPQGAVGPQGSQGAQGDVGPQGVTGAQGFQGPQGFQGTQGATGSQGAQGFQGDTGPQGSQGPQGFQGAQGPQGLIDPTVTTTFTTNQIIQGTTTAALLRVTQLGTGNAIAVEDSTNPDSTPFVVDQNGSVGIGSTSLAGYTIRMAQPITGAVESFGIFANGTVQSDVTTGTTMFASGPLTAASVTVPSLYHFAARGTTLGSGGAVTTQGGFVVQSSMTQASNNRGFWGNLAAASGTYNLYMGGTADNYLAGSLGIGAVPTTARNLAVSKDMTGSTTARGVTSIGTVRSDVTSTAGYFATSASVENVAFTVTNVNHFEALQGTFGASATISNQTGFLADSTLIGGGNNFGFRGRIANATGRWNLYMDGTADNYIAGALGIATTSVTGFILRIAKTITGATTSYGINIGSAIQSDVTTTAYYVRTNAQTAAAAFTVGTVYHYAASQGAIGAGSAITVQGGFVVESTMSGATNNRGFVGNLAAASNTFNLYMAGTADNYLLGRLGVGVGPSGVMLQVTNTTAADKVLVVKGAASQSGNFFEVQNSAATVLVLVDSTGNVAIGSTQTATTLNITKNIVGAVNAQALRLASNVSSGVTGEARYMTTVPSVDASVAVGNLVGVKTYGASLGAGATITSQFGFWVNSDLTAATSNYGFYGDIAAASGRWNLYMNGTARNYLAGGLEVIAGTTGMTAGFTHVPSAAGAPTGAPTNPTGNTPLYYDTTNNKLYAYNGAWKSVTLA